MTTSIDGNVPRVRDDGKVKAHKPKSEARNEEQNDNITSIDGNVTPVKDDGKVKAHKPKAKFHLPVRKPTKSEERKMFSKAMELMITVCMKNHVYRFENKLRVQSKGGPIGLGLTGEVADCFMLKWDKKFIQATKDLGISLTFYSRFKDDIFVSAKNLEKGTKFKDGRLVIDDQKKLEDEDRNDEKITMEVLQQIANQIDPMIKFTIDIPSDHEDGKLAVLDLKLKVNKIMKNRIDYEFYEKPTKNPKILLANSAINSSSKRTILTQECLRRIRNTKVELGVNVRNKHLNDFMLKMKKSGYTQEYRTQILKSALKAFQKMVEEDKNGTKPLFRSKQWNMEHRAESKRNKIKNWYKNEEKSDIQYKSILFVPPTPGSQLLKELRKREDELNGKNGQKIKIVEKGGVKMERILTNKYPFKPEKCDEKSCLLCEGALGI